MSTSTLTRRSPILPERMNCLGSPKLNGGRSLLPLVVNLARPSVSVPVLSLVQSSLEVESLESCMSGRSSCPNFGSVEFWPRASRGGSGSRHSIRMVPVIFDLSITSARNVLRQEILAYFTNESGRRRWIIFFDVLTKSLAPTPMIAKLRPRPTGYEPLQPLPPRPRD